MTHPFERLNQEYHDRAEDRQEAQFEEERVSYVLKALKVKKYQCRAVLDREQQASGQARLTFRSFNEEFPAFPILLMATTLPDVHPRLHLNPRAMIPSLFKRFEEAPWIAAYEAFMERNATRANGRALGMVFRRKGILGGLILLDSDIFVHGYRGSIWSYYNGSKDSPSRLFLRPFVPLIEAIHKSRCWH